MKIRIWLPLTPMTRISIFETRLAMTNMRSTGARLAAQPACVSSTFRLIQPWESPGCDRVTRSWAMGANEYSTLAS